MDAATRIAYDLAKKVPDMCGHGFTIETAYGEIVIDSTDAEPFARLVTTLLERKLQELPL